jgi:hypothetical protein
VKASIQVEALTQMSKAVEASLRNLLLYFGEASDGPDARKPEDFFALIASFSSDLQVGDKYSFTVQVSLSFFFRKQPLSYLKRMYQLFR